MKYIINNSYDTAFNIALEEYAFKHLLDEDMIFLLWINKPSIIVGRHQNTIEEINRDYVREHGIEVVLVSVEAELSIMTITISTTPSFPKKLRTKPLILRASLFRSSRLWKN